MILVKKTRKRAAISEERELATPIWRKVQTALEREIDAGEFCPGQKLPSEEALAERFSVHRHTVRRAIAKLQDKHVVKSEQGRGTYVLEQGIQYRVGRDTRLTTVAQRGERNPVRAIRSRRRASADRLTAYHLSLPLGHPIQEVSFLRMVDGRAVASAICFYPLPRFEGIGIAIEELGSITEAMRRYGVEKFPRKSTRINAAIASAEDSRLLGVPRRSPLLELLNVNVDKSGVPVQLTKTRLNSTLINLVFDF